jgi:S-DNA-T family DNA segregation ATPase FtsK/SpoIIIE
MFSISSSLSDERSEGNPSFRPGREAAALLLFAAAAYLGLALFSLRSDPADPTLHGGDWVGPVGAAIGKLLVQGFGIVAWLLPVQLAARGAPLFRGKVTSLNAFQVAGDLLVGILLCALIHIVLPNATAFGRMPFGGNVGLVFGELLQALFSTAGSLLVGTTLIALILIGRSAFSFIESCRLALQIMGRLGERSGSFSRRLIAAWKEARELRRQRLAEREQAAQPEISTPSRDAAIIAQLEEESSEWIPIEQTGSPPLAISQALKASAAQQAALLRDTETPAARSVAADAAAVSLVAHPVAEAKPAAKSASRARQDIHEQETPVAEPPLKGEQGAVTARVATGRKAAVDGASSTGVARADDKRSAESAEPTIVDTRHLGQVKRSEARKVKGRATGFVLPASNLLNEPPPVVSGIDRERIVELSHRLEKTLADYGVVGKVIEVHPGPTVTTYEFLPEAGTKVSKVANLADDLALGLSRKVRIIAPIPGKGRIGFELPNDERTPVSLRDLIEDKRFETLSEKAPLPVVLGRDIVGAPYYADLASMPHAIVAGATGAGKSVGLNVMLSSLLFRRTPDELRLLMIDPKVVELAPYDGIPHMLLPVVTDMKQAATALKWAVDEMERRYQAFANAGTKNITTYNNWTERIARGEIPPPPVSEVTAIDHNGAPVSVSAAKEGSDGSSLPGKLPYIVVVVDEFADLMMQQGKEVEACVARLAQKARAAGMHVILATQRPSVDVITGIIKANFPTRMAFRVAQKVDSRTILDEQGAEILLGKGDMLIKMNGSNEMRRVQCPFVSEEEVDALTAHLRAQGEPVYHHDILKVDEEDQEEVGDDALDPRFDEAVQIVADTQRCSTSWLQRKMTIGYNRAAKIVEMMEKKGMVGPPNGARDREIFLHQQ